MKTILLLAFCSLALNIQAMEVKNDTIDRYIIDKQVVARFDGTQLEGKTISKYIIAYKNSGDTVERNHVIITDNNTITLKGNSPRLTTNNHLIIVDGKETPANNISSLKTEEIAGMEIYKAGSKVANSYGDKGKNGVLVITTKTGKSSGNIYFINGKRVDKAELDNLSPDKIASMNINKQEGASVIEIVTK